MGTKKRPKDKIGREERKERKGRIKKRGFKLIALSRKKREMLF